MNPIWKVEVLQVPSVGVVDDRASVQQEATQEVPAIVEDESRQRVEEGGDVVAVHSMVLGIVGTGGDT